MSASNEISVGDLVCVVRWPCCGLNIGKVGIVAGIDTTFSTFCVGCGAGIDNSFPMPNADFNIHGPKGSLACVPLAWLRRIDPLSEPNTVETEEGSLV